jgi:hypothetical protein
MPARAQTRSRTTGPPTSARCSTSLEPSRRPGQESPETAELSFGGWTWRYELEATGPSRTTVTLTYDWSAVPPQLREYIQVPPFGKDHLDNSLQHLSDLVT